MRRLASFALVAALGLGATTLSKPADAAVAVGVGVGLEAPVAAPSVAGYAPLAAGYYPGYYGGLYRYPRYHGPGFARWGYGWHRGGYRGGYRGHWR